MSLKHTNLQMQNSKEELEQYGTWLCLRINGVPVEPGETNDAVLIYVKEIFDEGQLDTPIPLLIELIGLVQNILIIRQGKSVRLFLSDLHYSLQNLCRAMKKIRNNVKIRLDLTKKRHAVLVEVNHPVKGNSDAKFCFVGIKCRGGTVFT